MYTIYIYSVKQMHVRDANWVLFVYRFFFWLVDDTKFVSGVILFLVYIFASVYMMRTESLLHCAQCIHQDHSMRRRRRMLIWKNIYTRIVHIVRK